MTLVCVVLEVDSPGQYTDTRKLLDYGFENFQVLSIADNDTGVAEQVGENLGLLNNNEPFVKLDENAYIIMPKAAEFSDAAFELDVSDTDDDTVGRLKYTYAGRVVGNVGIIKTQAAVEENYFEQNAQASESSGTRVIRIKPVMILAGLGAVLVLAVLIYFGKKLYDNFYVIRHRWEMKRIEKARFKVNERKKKWRRRDRMFK